MTASPSFSWPWLALLGLGLAMALTGDKLAVVPERWAGLRQLHPQAIARFLALFKAIEGRGYQVVFTSGYRPDSTLSYHYFGLAGDINLIHIASGRWYKMADSKVSWEATGIPQLIRDAGFRWGGDFTMPVSTNYPNGNDAVHIDLGHFYNIVALRAQAQRRAGSKPLAQFDGRKVSLTA